LLWCIKRLIFLIQELLINNKSNIILYKTFFFKRKIHSILRYQTESNQIGCINYDENAVNNMIKIIKSYLIDKTRPKKYRWCYKFFETVKDDNSNIVSVKYHHA
jgi:hypothetical protein